MDDTDEFIEQLNKAVREFEDKFQKLLHEKKEAISEFKKEVDQFKIEKIKQSLDQ